MATGLSARNKSLADNLKDLCLLFLTYAVVADAQVCFALKVVAALLARVRT
jgi:hypothetical protein